MTTGEVSAHLAEVYGARVSKETISTITLRACLRRQPGHQRGVESLRDGLRGSRLLVDRILPQHELVTALASSGRYEDAVQEYRRVAEARGQALGHER